jgi:hypothetical protein
MTGLRRLARSSAGARQSFAGILQIIKAVLLQAGLRSPALRDFR